MADMMSTLRSLLGDNADEKIQSAMNMLKTSGLMSEVQNSSNNSTNVTNFINQINDDIKVEKPAPKTNAQVPTNNVSNQSTSNLFGGGNMGGQNVLSPEGLQFINQIRGMVNQMSNTNDNRSNLLRSLRPFVNTQRQQTIDRAIRIMNISRFSGLFGK